VINHLLNKKLNLQSDLVLTMLNGLVVIFGVFLLNGYISRTFGIDYLGEYLLVRRIILSAIGIILIGLNISIPTLIAKDNNQIADSSIFIFLGISLPLIFLFIALIQNDIFGALPNINFFSYSIFIVGTCLQFITYGLYRGHLNMVGANIIQLTSTAIIPIIIFLLKPNLNDALRNIGVALTLSNIIFFFLKTGRIKITPILIKRIKQILKFGMVRLPSIIAQFILLAVVPILISTRGNFSEVAYYTASLALLRSSLIIIGPIGIILLPRIAKAIAMREEDRVRSGIEVLIEITILFSILISISLSLFGGEIMNLWLGEISDRGAWIVKTLLLFMPFYLFIDILRSPIDAMSEKGINSIVYSLAAIALLVSYYTMISFGFDEIKAGVFSFGIAYFVASLSAFIVVRDVLRITMPNKTFFTICSLSVGTLIIFHKFIEYSIELDAIKYFLYIGVLLFITIIVTKIFFKQWRLKLIR
jgi:O-antigen/teichoic acid export membrane protein